MATKTRVPVRGTIGKSVPLPASTVSSGLTLAQVQAQIALSAQNSPPPAGSANTVANSITGTGRIGAPLELVGDVATPGNSYLYGTNASGVKGWYVQPSGSGSGANPTAKVALAAVNGTAPTFMRSDAAPPIDQTITPTWTGTHVFAPAAGNPWNADVPDGNSCNFAAPAGATVGVGFQFFVGTSGKGWVGLGTWAAVGATVSDLGIGAGNGNKLRLVYGSAGTQAVLVDTDGSVQVGAPTGGSKGAGTINATGLYVNGVAVGGGSSILFGEPSFVVPPTTGWTWTSNPGGASAASTLSGAALLLTVPSSSGSLDWYERAVTSSTCTITACLLIQPPIASGTTYSRYGIFVRNTSTGAIEEYSVDCRTNPPALSIYQDANYTTYTTTFIGSLSTEGWPLVGVPLWLRISNSSGNALTFSVSMDGTNFTPVGTDTAAFVGAVGSAGLIVENDGAVNAFTTVYSWNVTYP